MARRATYFFDVHQSQSPRLLVSGGWEFSRPNTDAPSPELMKGLAKAYDFMKYDVALLGKVEAEYFAEASLKADSTRKTAEEESLTIITTIDGDKVAFVRFPSLHTSADIPNKSTLKKIASTLKKARKQAKLVVGMSDWGLTGEREYLLGNPKILPDILLGSGAGSGINGRVEADGRCIWVRPYDKGRTVNEVKVYAWPDRTKPFAWKEPDTFSSLSTGLGDQYADHPEVKAILQ